MPKLYRKAGLTEMTPWVPGTDMDRVSVSAADREEGSPKAGDMIAWNPVNSGDRWLIASDYFNANYVEA